jgi:hypothetical protein
MKTKLFSITATLLFCTVALQAQVNFGLIGGANFQNITGTSHNGNKLENGLLVGFHAGVKVNVPIATDFYFQTGLLYSQKGAKSNEIIIQTKAANNDYSTITRISYIELPLNLLFKPQFGNGHILLGFGPYVAMGIGGKQKYDASSTLTYEQTIKFKNSITSSEYWDLENAYYKRLDAGANIFAGYELDMGLFFQFNAQLGLLKINPVIEDYDNDEAVFKNTGFGLSVGYMF